MDGGEIMWSKLSNMAYKDLKECHAEALGDLNQAIQALYRLSAGAWTGSDFNTNTDVQKLIEYITGYKYDQFDSCVADFASKLEQVRSLVFAEDLDWHIVENKLRGGGNNEL